jgi:thiamine-phosphate diphosphorylase
MVRCYVTDRHRGDIVASARHAVADGVDFIQVREKDLSAREQFALIWAIRDVAAGSRTRILVNDRLDIALAAGADGVHLPANGLPPDRVRPLVSVLGVSTHSLEDAIEAERAHPDFIIFGPVFETPGKQPVGLDALRTVVSRVGTPVLAIGGITKENAPLILEVGAAGFAAIRLFQQ